jgi:hypothetical protein
MSSASCVRTQMSLFPPPARPRTPAPGTFPRIAHAGGRSPPLPRLVGLSPIDAQPQTAGHDGDVLDMDGNEFGASQRADKVEQQGRAVPPAARALIASKNDLAQHFHGQGRSFSHRPAVSPENALQRALENSAPVRGDIRRVA